MTRARILESALRLFASQGYQETTLVDVAEASGQPLEEVYRQFPGKPDLVLSLYQRLAVRLEERLPELTSPDISERFATVMAWKIELLTPYRESLLALFEEMADGSRELGVLSPSTEPIRVRVTGIFASVAGSPEPELVRLLYRLHLGLTWIWFKEPRLYPGLLAASKALLTLSSPLLPHPPVKVVLKAADRLSAKLAGPHDLEWDAIAEKILRRVFLRRRLLHAESPCANSPCPTCLAPHMSKVKAFLDRNEPIEFVLPAFPAKSPNPQKTIGKLPDLGEELALRTLQTICDEIADLYSPGARVIICSDGHVFSDLVGVADEEVTAYHQNMRELVQARGHRNIELFCLADIHPDPEYPRLREELARCYGEPLEDLKQRTGEQPHHRALFDGIHRFLFEDRVVLHPEFSRSKNRKEAKPLAYQVIARSNAWSRLVAEHFPRAVRLSIHPQPVHSEKIGIQLTRAVDNWITPWHGSILLEDEKFLLLKRSEAEEKGATLVESDGRPSHFVIEQ